MSSGPSPAGTGPSPSVGDWAGPSRRARAAAVVLAVVVAVLLFLVVNRVWHGAAPTPRPVKPSPIEVRLVRPSPPVPAASGR